jgi:hypothetical protein
VIVLTRDERHVADEVRSSGEMPIGVDKMGVGNVVPPASEEASKPEHEPRAQIESHRNKLNALTRGREAPGESIESPWVRGGNQYVGHPAAFPKRCRQLKKMIFGAGYSAHSHYVEHSGMPRRPNAFALVNNGFGHSEAAQRAATTR